MRTWIIESLQDLSLINVVSIINIVQAYAPD